MSKYLSIIFCFFMLSTVSAQMTESYGGWIAYPYDDTDGDGLTDVIGLINPVTGEERLLDAGRNYDPESLRWSEDYTTLYYWSGNVYALDVLSGQLAQLTYEYQVDYFDISPDASMVAYLNRIPEMRLVVMDRAGNYLHDVNGLDIALQRIRFSPDGRYVIFQVGYAVPKLYALDTTTWAVNEISVADDDGGVIENGFIFRQYSASSKYFDMVVIDFDARQAMQIELPEFHEYYADFVLDDEYLLYFYNREDFSGNGLQLLHTENRETIDIDTNNLFGFDVSPDGEMLAYIHKENRTQLCTMSLISFEHSCFEFNIYRRGRPAWSA